MKRLRSISPFVVLLAVSLPQPAGAADSTAVAPRHVVLQDTVVVQSTKLPFRLDDLAVSGTILSSAQIRLGTARSLQDALAPVPGVHLLDLSGSEVQGAVETRGFASQGTSSHMVVLIDEIPVNDFETGRVDWNALGLAQVDRIEFLRGPASFLYGNASMSGVVNLVTVGAAAGRTGWAQASGGSWGRSSGAGGATWGTARAQAALSFAGQRLDGWRDHSAFESWSGYASGHLELTPRWGVRARLLGQNEDLDVPGPLDDSLFHADPRAAGTPLDHRRAHLFEGALEMTGRLAPSLGLTAVATRDQRRADATETIIPVGALDRLSTIGVMGGEARLHWGPTLPWTPHVLLGGDVENGSLHSEYAPVGSPDGQNVLSRAHVERLSGGLFAVAQVHPLPRWAIDAAARLDWLRSAVDREDGAGRSPNDDLRAFSPSLGTSVDLPRLGHAYASYAGSFKAPTLEQLYDVRPFDIGFGPFTISYSSLQPQRGDHFEAGLRSRLGAALASDLTGYYARARDEIGFDLAALHHINIEHSTHYGVEAQLVSEPVAGVSGRISYALTRALFDGGPHDGKQINTVPRQQLQARLSYAHRFGGTVSVEETWVRDQWIDEDNTLPIAPYSVVDLGVTQPLGRMEWFGSVRNLLDERYATLGYVTLGGGGLYFPGAARSFELGLRLRAGTRTSNAD